MDFKAKNLSPKDNLFRVARQDYDSLWPPIEVMGNNRFDDPQKQFGVLYTALTPQAALIEVLQYFRGVDQQATNRLLYDTDEPESIDPAAQINEFIADREMLKLQTKQEFKLLDISHSESIESIKQNQRFGELVDFNNEIISHLDLSIIFSSNRSTTQAISRLAFEEGFDGIYYPSKFGIDLQCIALFRKSDEIITVCNKTIIDTNNQDFVEILLLIRPEPPPQK